MMSAGPFIIVLVALWFLTVAGMVVAYRATIVRAWREPTLRDPVLIIESDDWGPGPDQDATWLQRIAEVLGRHADGWGRHPVVTIGVVLAVPDGRAAEWSPGQPRLTLADDRFRRVRESLLAGANARVLALQLHGMDHYWPAALRDAARRDSAVARWLRGEGLLRTEALPAHLQTRWADTSTLPSVPLSPEMVSVAVREELWSFAEIFGGPASVVVPPTFVWDERVEREWASGGVKFLVTPGRRYVGRDEAGRLIADKAQIYNGERGDSGILYLVRDCYFEPSLGHDAAEGLAALARKTRAGRPALLEMHRFNFTGEQTVAEKAVTELDRLLGCALKGLPKLRFLSSEELGERLAARDSVLVETRFVPRFASWLVRLGESSRLRKLAWLTGLALPALPFLFLARPAVQVPGAEPTGERLAT